MFPISNCACFSCSLNFFFLFLDIILDSAGTHKSTNHVVNTCGSAVFLMPVMQYNDIIYMHYVLIWWFKEKIQPNLRGFSGLVVYADDFVCCFQHKKEAEQFYARLKKRMGHFGLELEESKSRLIEFGRYAEELHRPYMVLLRKNNLIKKLKKVCLM